MVLRAPASQQAAAQPTAAPLGPVAVPAPEDTEGAAAPYASAPPAMAPVEPVRRPAGPLGAAASTVPGVGNGLRRIFQEMTGAGLMRRNAAPPQPQSQPQTSQTPPRGPDPARPPGGAAAQQPRPAQPEEIGLDIPTFLRRQNN